MSKTIPEQLSDALAEVATLKAQNADSGALLAMKTARDSLASQNAALTAEITDLKLKLATAETGVAGAVKKALDDARASMEEDFDMRVSNRAVEIMASVGQSVPSSFLPEGRQPKPSAKAAEGTHRAAVEAMYREKYNIT